MHASVHRSAVYSSWGMADARDGGVEGRALLFSCENAKITTRC